MELRECKKCLLLQSGEEENYKLVQEYIQKIKSADKCPDELYQERLKKCKDCDNLISGVCLKCGCYVEFRAAYRNKKCPDTKRKAW